MKRIWIFVLLAALILTGCSNADQELPPGWDENWVRIADYIGVEPLDGFTLNESNDLLSASGLYYAAWAAGNGQSFVNADGKDATVYDAQIYVLLQECRNKSDAEKAVEAWIDRERQSYETEDAEAKTFGVQEYKVLPLISGGGDNPYTHGAAAFAVRDAWAISVELVCADGFDEEPAAILEQFLTGFHYAEE